MDSDPTSEEWLSGVSVVRESKNFRENADVLRAFEGCLGSHPIEGIADALISHGWSKQCTELIQCFVIVGVRSVLF